MKLYIISGLGADEKVLSKLRYNGGVVPVHLPWLIPHPDEAFPNYVRRMAEKINDSEPFYLMGYSFGGIVAQEIHKLKPAKKTVILGSIRCDAEKSDFIKFGQRTNALRYLPLGIFGEPGTVLYTWVRKFFDPKNPRLMDYFQVRDPYYLKWSMDKVARWKFDKLPGIIQILADKDVVFPIKNSRPDYVVSNATHLFPATRPKEVSEILKHIFI